MPIELRPHPTSPPPLGLAVVAEVERPDPGRLSLRFRVRGPLEALCVPEPAPARYRLGLWQHTCFEAFLGTESDEAYHEINLSPSGEWAVLAFRAYRDRSGELHDEIHAPAIDTRIAAPLLELTATIPLRPLGLDSRHLRLGLAAVLESRTGSLSYWAPHHPAPHPDFHRLPTP